MNDTVGTYKKFIEPIKWGIQTNTASKEELLAYVNRLESFAIGLVIGAEMVGGKVGELAKEINKLNKAK